MVQLANHMSDETVETRRVIKRYSNRKLYDTKDSRYVTLQQIGEMVRHGDDVQIIDNKTKEDKTEVTLALILSEDLKNKPRSVPLGTLRTLIQERGEKLMDSLRTGPFGRLLPVEKEGEEGALEGETAEAAPEPAAVVEEPAAEEEGNSDSKPKQGRLDELRQNIDLFQASLDERVKAIVFGSSTLKELRDEIEALKARVTALEQKLAATSDESADGQD